MYICSEIAGRPITGVLLRWSRIHRDAGGCHPTNSMSWFQSHVPHCRVLPLGKFNVMPSQSHVSHCRVLSPGEFNVMSSQSHVPHCTMAPGWHAIEFARWQHPAMWHVAATGYRAHSLQQIRNDYSESAGRHTIVQFFWRWPTPVLARTLMQEAARMKRKSVHSHIVSTVLPSIRPSDPPMSHSRDSQLYASWVSTCVTVSSEKNICTIRNLGCINSFCLLGVVWV